MREPLYESKILNQKWTKKVRKNSNVDRPKRRDGPCCRSHWFMKVVREAFSVWCERQIWSENLEVIHNSNLMSSIAWSLKFIHSNLNNPWHYYHLAQYIMIKITGWRAFSIFLLDLPNQIPESRVGFLSVKVWVRRCQRDPYFRFEIFSIIT